MITAALEGSDIVSMLALAGALAAGIAALVKIGPERQTSIVGAQDTVIDNLREEVARHKAERDEEAARARRAIERIEERRKRDIAELERKLAEESAVCEERIGRLEMRLKELEANQ